MIDLLPSSIIAPCVKIMRHRCGRRNAWRQHPPKGREDDEANAILHLVLANGAARFAHAIRSHRGIENRLHRVLDVTFRDDDSRVRKYHATANFADIRHIALNLPGKAKGKHSLRGMRKKAGWNNRFLFEILTL